MERDSAYVTAEVDGQTILVEVADVEGVLGDEIEVDGRLDPHKLEQAFQGLASAARLALDQMSAMQWKKAVVELTVSFAVESGSLVAILGKVGTNNSMKIQLEFER